MDLPSLATVKPASYVYKQKDHLELESCGLPRAFNPDKATPGTLAGIKAVNTSG
jgi:hypothetical protein